MATLITTKPGFYNVQKIYTKNIKFLIFIVLLFFILFFTLSSKMLQAIEPTAAVLDLGLLTVALFGLLVGGAAILCSLWLQELLWKPFKVFRQHFNNHFNQLTSWQQCILYFSVFFLLLYAGVMVMGVVL